MISWIKGEVISLWQTNNKFFILVSCNGLGYEIQILETDFIKLKTNQINNKYIILWIKHIKKEDSDSFFGFITQEQKEFFIKILNIKGIGSQIGMAILSKFSIDEIIDAINRKDKKLIGSVPGIGQKMTERIILELKINLNIRSNNNEERIDNEFLLNNQKLNSIFEDLVLALKSLNYPNNEIKKLTPILIKKIKNTKITKESENKISFENLLKQSMDYLDNKNSNLGQ